MGPPEWGLHRIILFFLYSSSLLCSEPTHVFGRTRWLTLANGNQKTSESNLVVTYPKLRGASSCPKINFSFLWSLPHCVKKPLIRPGLSEVRWSSQAAAFVEWKELYSGLWERSACLSKGGVPLWLRAWALEAGSLGSNSACLRAPWQWASCLTSPSLSLLICKMGQVAAAAIVVIMPSTYYMRNERNVDYYYYYVLRTMLNIKELIIKREDKHKAKRTRLERPQKCCPVKQKIE